MSKMAVHRSYLVAAEAAMVVVMAHWTEIRSPAPNETTCVIAHTSLVAAKAKTIKSHHRENPAITPPTIAPSIMLLSPTREWLALRLTPQSLLRVSTLLATTSYSLLSLIQWLMSTHPRLLRRE